MELDQIVKRLEWLDEEHRKDKTSIATLEARIISLEGGIPALSQQIKDLNGEITRIASSLGRLDQFDASLAQTRVEFTRALDGFDKARTDHDREVEKVRRFELEGINKAIGELKRATDHTTLTVTAATADMAATVTAFTAATAATAAGAGTGVTNKSLQ